MAFAATLLSSALWSFAHASQPGAVSPVAAPMRDITWGKLNFLHTTDTHGWLGGHLLEPQYSADWGDYVSFAEHMRKQADDKGVDLLLVDTGDRVEGNGLYDSSTPKGLYTYDIFHQQSVDLMCSGNHELYKAPTADREHNTTVPYFKENYMASNLDYMDDETGVQVPLAQRYRKFKTKNQGLEVISFGFLFNFDMNANNTVVKPVEETIKEEWFLKVLKEETPDVFVVVGHVGLRMPEFKAIFETIRKASWYTPILFFGGHAHVRDARKFDDKSFAMASGRYGETIGWASIDGLKNKAEDDAVSAAKSVSYSRKYIDNNLYGMYHHTGLNESTFATEKGKETSRMIQNARDSLELDYTYGCAPKNLWTNRAKYPSEDSIYSWLEKEVLPGAMAKPNSNKNDSKSRLAIINTGAMRFDIFKGPFTRDSTFIVSPFTSKFRVVRDVPYKIASKVIAILNNGGPIFDSTSLDARSMNVPEVMAMKDLSVGSSSDMENDRPTKAVFMDSEQLPLGGGEDGFIAEKPDLMRGYTTKDDLGKEGDDTEHSPIQFYSVPNCVQAEVNFPDEGDPGKVDLEKVDLLFLDFIEKWVLVALKFSGGGSFKDSDVEAWDDDTLTDKLGEWIKENWKKDC